MSNINKVFCGNNNIIFGENIRAMKNKTRKWSYLQAHKYKHINVYLGWVYHECYTSDRSKQTKVFLRNILKTSASDNLFPSSKTSDQ
jgi:hypothetical protein